MDLNNISSDDEEIYNNTNAHKMSFSTPLPLHDSKPSSLPPLTTTTDIIGNISSTDDSSSDSDESSDEEEDVNDKVDKTTEESTMFILEQVNSLKRVCYVYSGALSIHSFVSFIHSFISSIHSFILFIHSCNCIYHFFL